MTPTTKLSNDIGTTTTMANPEEHSIRPKTAELITEKGEKVGDMEAVSGLNKPESGAQIDQIRQIVVTFLQDISYEPPHIARNTELEEALLHILRSWDIDDNQGGKLLERVAKYSAAMSDLSFYDHEFDLKLQLALFTWFIIFMDDIAVRIPGALQSFQERMHQRLPQLDPVLTHFGAHLSDMYLYFDPICANSIVCAALEFVNGCAMEVKKEIISMPLNLAALEWPYFLRAKTGLGAAYGYFIFSKKRHPDMTAYIQAMGDIIIFIGLSNDVLSFYKEELAGEDGNYIHNRSKTLGQDPVKVLSDVAGEALAARNRIIATLEGEPEALAAWKTYEQGSMTFHTSQERYKLGELDPSLAVELL